MPDLTTSQRALLDDWLGEWAILEEHSWPLQDTTVLRVRDRSGADHIVRASTTSHHIAREIDSHVSVLAGLDLPIPAMEHFSREAGILVCTYLDGSLVLGSPAEENADIYRQAGALLTRLQVPGAVSEAYVPAMVAGVRSRIAEASGLVPKAQLAALEVRLGRFRSRAVRLHFTHGDYGPRNWLVRDGAVSVIDFGRGAQRSWVSDLVRLQNQQFVGRPHLEAAFWAGLGRTLGDDDRESWRWRLWIRRSARSSGRTGSVTPSSRSTDAG
jgi:tRNA A-37 threonylcarbamoyl transferase component Bud32